MKLLGSIIAISLIANFSMAETTQKKSKQLKRDEIAISNKDSDYSAEYLNQMKSSNSKPKESIEYKRHLHVIDKVK